MTREDVIRAVIDERMRCIQICRETEARHWTEFSSVVAESPNSYGAGALWGSAQTAAEIRKEILGEEE